MPDPVHFELTDGEKATPLWIRLKQHLIAKLGECRARNDDSAGTMTEQQTAALRGEIKALKRVIALGDDRPPTGD